MGGAFIAFLITVFLVAVFTRDSYAFVLLYLFAGAFLLSRWWLNRTASSIVFERKFDRRAFPGETIPVRLKVRNTSRLPLVWLQVQESLPLEISNIKILRKVITLSSRGQETLDYQVTPTKRGYYSIGPVHFSTGDLLGLVQERAFDGERDYLTVYPRVVPFSRVQLPSQSPLGDLRYEQPIYEDPSRPIGKRDYRAGDSLRRIDWKSSAAVGRMQTKLFEPSIALETILFLNLNSEEYHYKFRYDAAELAIVVAASLANWIVGKKQSVGLVVNGTDPFTADGKPRAYPARKGRSQLMRLLETLARVQLAPIQSLAGALRQKRVEFAWGTTIIVITGSADEALFDQFFQMRRSGLNLVLVLCGEIVGAKEIKARARQFGIHCHQIRDENDLDIWRK
jgi:uncharacterized protein (DUF58 family)